MADDHPQGRTTPSHSQRIARFPLFLVKLVRWVLHRGVLAVVALALALLWLWTAVALAVYEPWPKGIRALAILLWVTLPFAGQFWVPRIVPIREFTHIVLGAVVLVGYIATRLLWDLWSPSNDRAWVAEQARMPLPTFASYLLQMACRTRGRWRSCRMATCW